MLSEQEILQICSTYELGCPVCETKNTYFRLKRDVARAVDRRPPSMWRAYST